MKAHRAVGSVLIVLVLLSQNGTSTIVASTMLMGFMGGFLVGKITLGTFLTLLSQIGRPQIPAQPLGTVANPLKVSTRFNEISGDAQSLSDIHNSVDSQVRDQFLRQLGKMDPLNCLPKVFCEISSNPEMAASFFGRDTPFPLSSIPLTSFGVKHNNAKKKEKEPLENEDEEQDDNENEDDTSDSESEEDDKTDEDDALLKKYEKKEADDLESKALDEMIQEFDDPIDYYFILKDKNKNIHPELQQMIKNGDSRRSIGSITGQSSISKRMGEVIVSSAETETTRRKKPSVRTSSSTVDDIFAADPFFDEFSRSLKFPIADANEYRSSNVVHLRRSKREMTDEDGILIRYRMAARVAERYKNPTKCQRVFNTCPFSTKDVLSMITQLDSHQDANKPYAINKKKTDSMKNLHNTLLAIEKLNSATILAKSSGTPVDYGQIMEEALQSQLSDSSATSTKIVKDFEGFADQIETESSTYKIKNSKKSKQKSSKGSKKKASVRRRRHGEMPPHIEVMQREPRISLSATNASESNSTEVPLLASTIIPEALKKTVQVDSRIKEKSEPCESDENLPAEPKFEIASLGGSGVDKPSILGLDMDPVKDAESRIYKSEEIDEDDEATSVESEEPFKVPTFSQTYVDTLQSPSKTKTKPRPVYPIVKIKSYSKRITTSTPEVSTTTTKYRRPAPLMTQKFSGEPEDDEEDAKLSEDAIDVIISKYKPKDKKSKP